MKNPKNYEANDVLKFIITDNILTSKYCAVIYFKKFKDLDDIEIYSLNRHLER